MEEGEIIGLLNGELVTSAETIDEVALQMLDQMNAAEHEIITAYYGEDVTEEQAQQLIAKLQDKYPDQDWELVQGGQPHYHYIMSAE